MENKFALNKEQAELVDKFISLVKEMKKANIICYNSKHLDEYNGDTALYDKDDLIFINGENIENIYVCSEYFMSDDLEIPNEQIQPLMRNFISEIIENDDFTEVKNLCCKLK